MNEALLNWLREKIDAGEEADFYRTYLWKQKSAEVRRLDRNECQICKARGRYRRAELVHHVNHLKDRPDLALDIYYTAADGTKRRNLISVCKDCHENVCHPEKLLEAQRVKKQSFETPERWD